MYLNSFCGSRKNYWNLPKVPVVLSRFQLFALGYEEAEMAIYRLLQNGPEEIALLTTAYEQTLRTLSLKDRNDPLTQMIAKKIIRIAQTGIKDPAQISARTIRNSEFPEATLVGVAFEP